MAKHALIIGWEGATAGRASQAGECFGEWVGYWGEQLKSGSIERFLPVISALGQKSGQQNGFFMIEGDIEKLQTIRWSDQFQELFSKTLHVVDGFNINFSYVGEGVNDIMELWRKYI